MRRTAVFLLALLLLAATACPCMCEATQPFITTNFTLDIPADWAVAKFDIESANGAEYLGSAYTVDDPTITVTLFQTDFTDKGDMSLSTLDEARMQAYIDMLVGSFGDPNARYVGTVYAGGVPFVGLTYADDLGINYYFETMNGGYMIGIYVNKMANDEKLSLTDDEYARAEAIVASFRPAE